MLTRGIMPSQPQQKAASLQGAYYYYARNSGAISRVTPDLNLAYWWYRGLQNSVRPTGILPPRINSGG